MTDRPRFLRLNRHQESKNSGDPGPPSTSDASFEGTYTDRFNGSSNPQWKRQVRLGQNATTNADGIRTSFTPCMGRSYVKWKDFGNPNNTVYNLVTGYLYSGIPIASDPFGMDVSAADTQARLKFFSKYRQARTAFQGGTFFGELAETLRMLKSPAKALREGLDRYAKAAKRAAGKAGQVPKKQNAAVAETWLEYSFGWKPLYSDIKSLVDSARGEQRTYREPITAEASTPVSASDSDASFSMGFNYWNARQYLKGSASVRYKGAVAGGVGEPSFAEFVGLAPSNFIPTVWNLIPYSFLVDYFTNIGDLIESLSQGSISLAWGCRTERISNDLQVTRFLPGKAAYNLGSNLISLQVNASDLRSTTVRFRRSGVLLIWSSPLTDFQFKLPGVGSPWKWLNIGALARIRTVR